MSRRYNPTKQTSEINKYDKPDTKYNYAFISQARLISFINHHVQKMEALV